MSEMANLPEGFAELEPFVETWGIEGSANRAAKRSSSTPEEREAFFKAASPLMEKALDYLDERPVNALSPSEERLMNLMLSLAHIAPAVEIQGPDEIKSAPWRDRMRITRSSTDQGVRN
jgi:hypothetical protein